MESEGQPPHYRLVHRDEHDRLVAVEAAARQLAEVQDAMRTLEPGTMGFYASWRQSEQAWAQLRMHLGRS